jgi:hypothetical protein
MGTNFWLQFAVAEGGAVAAAYIASNPNLSAAQKTALEAVVAATAQVSLAFA